MREWTVTDYGLECGNYYIDAAGLTKVRTHETGHLYDWFAHLAIKRWFDLDDFIPRFREAFSKHGHEIDEAMLDRSIEFARKRRAERDAFDEVAEEMIPADDSGVRVMMPSDIAAVSAEARRRNRQ